MQTTMSSSFLYFRRIYSFSLSDRISLFFGAVLLLFVASSISTASEEEKVKWSEREKRDEKRKQTEKNGRMRKTPNKNVDEAK